MRSRLTAFGAATLLCALVSQADAQAATASTISRKSHPNDVGIELGGKAALYSFEYTRMVTPALGLGVGLGVVGGGGGGSDGAVIFIPAGAKLYVIPKDGSLFFTGGAVLATGLVETGSLIDASGVYGFGGLGFEYRAAGGFLFRGTAYVMFGSGGYIIWPGITLGFAF